MHPVAAQHRVVRVVVQDGRTLGNARHALFCYLVRRARYLWVHTFGQIAIHGNFDNHWLAHRFSPLFDPC